MNGNNDHGQDRSNKHTTSYNANKTNNIIESNVLGKDARTEECFKNINAPRMNALCGNNDNATMTNSNQLSI